MTKLENYLNIGFNLFDQIAIEKVNNSDFYKLTLDGYSFFLRVFDLVLLYGIYFFFTKASQFILSLLFKVDIENISYAYYIIPGLFLFEYGATNQTVGMFNFLSLASEKKSG